MSNSVPANKRSCTEFNSNTIPLPERIGHTFDFWFYEPEAKNTVDFFTFPTKDTTLYSGWKPNPIYVGNKPCTIYVGNKKVAVYVGKT